MEKSIDFCLHTHAKFGAGTFKNINSYLQELNCKHIGIVIDKNVLQTNYAKQIINDINFNAQLLLYDFGEPSYDLLEQYRDFFSSVDHIVAIGGGSVIDFAKGLAVLSTNKKPALSYRGFPTNVNAPLPVVAIPTTAGTGSEVTYNAVFIDFASLKKLGINTVSNFPVLAILDPLLIQSCPKSVLISSGLDALTHAVESYGATKANPITQALSEKALNILMTNLSAITNKTSIKVCSNLQLAAYMAGIALPNSGSGPAGALSYILGPQFNIPHGLAGAIFLPHIIQHNEKKGFKYSIPHLASKVFTLCELFEIDNYNIRKYNVTKASDIRNLVQGIEILQPAFDQNPVPFTVEDAKDIIREMII